MEKPPLLSEAQKFHFGSKLSCTDGEDGALTHIGIDATARRITYIGSKSGRLFGKTVFLPYSAIVTATDDGITLNITRAELAAASTVAPSGILLDAHSVVKNTDTPAKGTLLLVAVQPKSTEIAYIVAHHLRPNQDTLLREETITHIDVGQISISLPEATLQTLPPYRPDAELQREVEDILFAFTPLHIDLPGISIHVRDSVLYLEGNISSSLRGDIAQDQVLGIQGLSDVVNQLVGDDTLASDLAMALGRDPRTRDLPIGVYPRLGVVRLSGAVHNAQQSAAAEAIARDFPGVRSVINDMVIDPETDLLRVMSASAGGEASDMIPGKYIRHTK